MPVEHHARCMLEEDTKQTCHRILNNRVVNVYLSYVNCTENIAYTKPTQTPNETKIDIYNCISHICNALSSLQR